MTISHLVSIYMVINITICHELGCNRPVSV